MNITHGLRRALQVNSCATTASDATRDVSGQVFRTRMNEIYLFSDPEPAQCGRLDPAGDCRAHPAGAQAIVHAARPLGRRVLPGPSAKEMRVSMPKVTYIEYNGTAHLVVVPAGPIQPYAVAGLGLIRPHAKFDSSSLSLDQNALGYDVGGGVNVFLAHSVGIRADVRHLHTLQDITLGNLFSSQPVDFWRGTLGLALRF